jgi:Tannase and feruloyl esterase
MLSRLTTPRLSSVVASLGMALLGSTFEARAAKLDVVAPVKPCADIKALDLSRGEAGPARIDSAELIAEGSQQFCAVKGYVAPAVNFVVRLPTSGWTQRYLQLGCGGYCGGATLTSGSVDRQSSGCTAYDDKEMVIASSDLGHRRSGTFFPDGVTRALAFNTDVTRLTCPVLIPEGGADPLVPRASLSVFNTGNEVRRSRTLAWPDWQHSIYERVDRHGI